jgi:hypothetical protein
VRLASTGGTASFSSTIQDKVLALVGEKRSLASISGVKLESVSLIDSVEWVTVINITVKNTNLHTKFQVSSWVVPIIQVYEK